MNLPVCFPQKRRLRLVPEPRFHVVSAVVAQEPCDVDPAEEKRGFSSRFSMVDITKKMG